VIGNLSNLSMTWKHHDIANRADSISDRPSKVVWLICLAGFALVAISAIRAAPQIVDLFLAADGDDQMRLVQVRDWLSGQGWFDVRQYRVLPPDGISMHWSRYVDAGIAAVMAAAGWAVPQVEADLAAVILWPSLLACLMVLILAHGTNRLFGPTAAVGALAVFFSWSKLGGEFVAPRIDHHNLQILCATAMFFLSVIPGRARTFGALGGIVTAFGLAIGLEMLPFYATIWGLMALRYAFDHEDTGGWLLGFGVSIVLSAVIFMAGQTPLTAWGSAYCDVLAGPVMALGAVGVVATLVPVIGARVLIGPTARIAMMLGISVLGLWLASPVLGRCLAGPYSDVPENVRSTIESTILEALSVSTMLVSFPAVLSKVLLPPLIIVALALTAFWRSRDRVSSTQATALWQAFVVAGLGFGFAILQIRAANLMTPAVPLLGGFLLYVFSQIPRTSARRVPAIVLLLLALPATIERGTVFFFEQRSVWAAPRGLASSVGNETNCRNTEAMAEIASLPRALIFTNLNLGPTVLAFTPQSVTSASYHRSPNAFWNGVGAFESEDALRLALMKSNADYLVLCRDGPLELRSRALSSIRAGKLPSWLSPAAKELKLVEVFKVNSSLLTPEDSTP
jgi:hypothetical protein